MTGTEARLAHTPPSDRPPLVRPDLAYILPMAVFLGFIWIGTQGLRATDEAVVFLVG